MLLKPSYLDTMQSCMPSPANKQNTGKTSVSMEDGDVNVPKVKTGEIDCKQGAVRAVRFSVDGNYCITAGQDKSLKLWNPNRGSLLKTYSGHGYEVLDAMGSCDNSQLVSCGLDKLVMLWDVSSGNVSRKWRGHAGAVNCVKLNEESTVAISGSVDTTVKVWDCRSKSQEPVQTMEECGDNVTSLDVSDHEILVGSGDSHVRRYDMRNGQLVTDFMGATVASVRFTRDGQCLLVGCVASTVKLMDKATGEMLQEYSGHINTNNYRLDITMDHTDKYVLSGSENGQVYIWDLVEGGCIAKLDHGGGQTVHSLAAHPAKCQLLTASRGHVYVWQDQPDEEEVKETVMSSSSSYDSKPHWM